MTTLAPTLSTRYFPRTAAWLRDLLLISTGVVLVAALAQVKIHLPFTPVPLTGQTFAVLLVGAALGSKRGVTSLMLYTALGSVGLPIFAGGASGLAYLSGPTFGYLIGFVAAAYTVGMVAERGLERSVQTSIVPFVLGTLVIYIFGGGWLSVLVGIQKALTLGVLPFLVGDVIKMMLAALALPAAWKLAR